MCATAIKKDPQYAPGFPNILVFVNHSDSLDLHLRSAVNEFGGAVRNAGASSPLRKLSVFFAAVSRIMLPPQVVSLTPMLGTDGNGSDAVFIRVVLADNSDLATSSLPSRARFRLRSLPSESVKGVSSIGYSPDPRQSI